MNIAFLCILLASVMPLVLAALAKRAGASREHRYDNRTPRQFLQNLQGWAQRANWAQQNCWEALPIFAASVVMASFAHVPQVTIDLWAIVFIVARVIYSACYILDSSALRSLFWAVATIASLRLMVAAIMVAV